MAKVKITADSTCDLSPELIERYNIDVLPLYVNMGDKSYRDGVDLKTADIYEHVKNGGDLPKTSAPAPADFIEFFKKWTEQGYEIVEGIKNTRGDESGLHKLFARSFYKIISGLTGFDMQNASDFKLLDKKVLDVLLQMPERKTFFLPTDYLNSNY